MSNTRRVKSSMWAVVGFVVGALAGCVGQEAPTPSKVLDLTGRPVDPLRATDAKAIVLIFVRTDCPISNRYAPKIRRLHEQYTTRGVTFYLVYPDPDQEVVAIRKHIEEFAYPCQALRDPHHVLVRLAEARVTPEAALFVTGRQMVYCGRIDNWYEDFGKARAAPTQQDLTEALDAVLDGRPVERARTRAVGCYIEDLQ